MSIVYLKKANDDVVAHCGCDDGRTTYPPQQGCPWCGCGWLFTCMTCRKAFAFAVGVELDATWEELAREDIRNGWKREASDDEAAGWAESMKAILADVEPGELYVILDGSVIPADCAGARFVGWYARHELDALPQVEALTDPAALELHLSNRDYWLANAVPKG